MPTQFVHLHVHTHYSLLASSCTIPALVQRAVEFEMPALAVTDYGNLFGAIEFLIECRNAGIKPIVGLDAYVAPKDRTERATHGLREASHRLVLLAANEAGYRNLLKLASAGYLEGFYYKPRIDKELLRRHAEGLIGLSGGMRGEVSHFLLEQQEAKAREAAQTYLEILGPENFYLELEDHGRPEQKELNQHLVALSKQTGVPLVATNNVHYLEQDHAEAQNVLVCIHNQWTLDDPRRMKNPSDQLYFKSAEQMCRLFSELPGATANTVRIAERCNLDLDFTQRHMPEFEPPQGYTHEAYLAHLCEEGLKSRYPNPGEEVRRRLKHELNIIQSTGYVSYFLIVWDFIRAAREKGIPVGPGRGSAAGSIIAYLLGITNIDPLRYGLLFERFLNPERVSMPDIDIDFCYERRGEVIEYVIQKYGDQNVAQIITFGTMMAKAVVRDVARVMAVPYAEADRIAKLIPNELKMTLERALELEPELKQLQESNEQVRKLLEISMVLEGLNRHASTHAAGVVVSREPITENAPLYKTGDGQVSTGYSMNYLEKIGLLKMDFLGLKTLTVIDQACKIIKRTRDVDVDIRSISLEDAPTFELLCRAETEGVFQLESSGMRDLLKKLQPASFEDVIALLALYRPGPIGSGMLDDFVNRKHSRSRITYDHPLLEPVLKETYGTILYQEQVMRIASDLAGFTLAQADLLRRAMGKKNPAVMEKMSKTFVEGALKRGLNRGLAEKIFGLIEYFSGYGFNKSHSAAYALISYQTAYLKANFPVEFRAALLTSERDNTDKVVQYISETRRSGIEVLPPDVNESRANFTVSSPNAIRFGLAAIKNVGEGAIESIVEARDRTGRFESLEQFCESVDTRLVNRKILESLIRCGAMDTLGSSRAVLMAKAEAAMESAAVLQRDRQKGQMSFFDGAAAQGVGFDASAQTAQTAEIEEWPESVRLAAEKELLGFYVSGHPLSQYRAWLEIHATCPLKQLDEASEEEEVKVGALIARSRLTTTKRTGERMAILWVEDLEGECEVLVFPETYKKCSEYLGNADPLWIRGRLSKREESPKILASQIISLPIAIKSLQSIMSIDLVGRAVDEPQLEALKGLLGRHPGQVPVSLEMVNGAGQQVRIMVGKDLHVTPSPALTRGIEGILGPGVVHTR
ncbi:MAG: DNA polymerase III subunit alpha [Candidatus Omnitrophica bacterium]|nr:DNA polymerase III subunit alpha [Candidatus Omnitrophota bacterium]